MNHHLTRTAALSMLALSVLTGCSDAKTADAPVSAEPSTSSTATTGGGDHPTATVKPAPDTTSIPTPDTITDPSPGRPGNATLTASAQQYATAVSVGRYEDVAAIACPGLLRGMSPKAYADSLSAAPRQSLTVEDARPGDIAAEVVAELVKPGVSVDEQALVTLTVGPGSQIPSSTVVARFVHSAAGWQYCGTLPDA